MTKLGIKLPALVVDRFDDAVEQAYSGWPDRLYLIGVDGRILYGSCPGPFGFKPADLESALRAAVRGAGGHELSLAAATRTAASGVSRARGRGGGGAVRLGVADDFPLGVPVNRRPIFIEMLARMQAVDDM